MSRFTAFCTLFLLFVSLNECSKISSHNCLTGETAYKKDTCIRTWTESTNYTDAERFCRYKDKILVTIDSAEKQKFVHDYLQSENVKGNIWIGLQYSDYEKNYVWPFDRIVDYANWEEGHPTNDPNSCVELKAESGKWSEKPCQLRNQIVICERIQLTISDRLFQTKVLFLSNDKVKLETKVKDLALNNNQLETKIKDLALKNDQLESKMKNLMNDIIPIGFIYVQLPKDKPPTEIWPTFKWVTVSLEYEGLFFRVEGKNASAFGAIQEQSAERINNVFAGCKSYHQELSELESKHEEELKAGTESDYFYTGGPDTGCFMQVTVRKREVRPRNTAVKIWRRNA